MFACRVWLYGNAVGLFLDIPVSGILISDISDDTYQHSEPLRADNAIRLIMPRVFTVVDPLQQCTSGTHLRCQTDWKKCVLYQKGIDEELSCPADAKHSITGTCCKTLTDNLLGCCLIDYLPNTTVDVANTDDGDGVQATFQCNRATWHDYCRLAFNNSQLFRAEEMGTTPCENIAEVLQKYSRQSVDETPHSKDKLSFATITTQMKRLYMYHPPSNLTSMAGNVH